MQHDWLAPTRNDKSMEPQEQDFWVDIVKWHKVFYIEWRRTNLNSKALLMQCF